MDVQQLLTRIAAVPCKRRRKLVGLIGAPASGKTTLAHRLSVLEPRLSVVPMDGFHLDNSILEKRGLLERKGAPDTFDAQGLCHMLERLAGGENAIYPIFDRSTERAVAGAGEISEPCDTVLVEGNYLLLDQPAWRPLAQMWDLTIKLEVPREALRARLLERWYSFGYSDAQAQRKTDENDLPNADLINEQSFPADISLQEIIL